MVAEVARRRRLFFDQAVNLASGLAGKDMLGDFVEDTCGQCAGSMHACEIRLLVNPDPVAGLASFADHLPGAPYMNFPRYLRRIVPGCQRGQG